MRDMTEPLSASLESSLIVSLFRSRALHLFFAHTHSTFVSHPNTNSIEKHSRRTITIKHTSDIVIVTNLIRMFSAYDYQRILLSSEMMDG